MSLRAVDASTCKGASMQGLPKGVVRSNAERREVRKGVRFHAVQSSHPGKAAGCSRRLTQSIEEPASSASIHNLQCHAIGEATGSGSRRPQRKPNGVKVTG